MWRGNNRPGVRRRLGPGIRRRIRIALLLTPAMAVIVLLFARGLIDGFLVSLGHFPVIGQTHLSLEAYRAVLQDPTFLDSLLLTFYIAATATLIATVLAVAAALALRSRAASFATLILQLPITVPYLVAAVGITKLVSQSGLIARLAAATGLIHAPAAFPAFVYDRYAVGIILTYVWKETPFIALIVLAALRGMTEELEQAARTLGANAWQCFRYITLPRITPAVTIVGTLVFAFSFGAFEIPLLLGTTYPQTLPVLAWNEYRSIDLSDRPQAMALAIIIALLTGLLAVLCLRLSRRLPRA